MWSYNHMHRRIEILTIINRTSFFLHLHCQHTPAFTLWKGKWKTWPIQSQSALIWQRQVWIGTGSVILLFLSLSVGSHALPSCLHVGLAPARECRMSQANTALISSIVLSPIHHSGKIHMGTLILPLLPGRPGKFSEVIATDSVRS